jgi:hypothetical protein
MRPSTPGELPPPKPGGAVPAIQGVQAQTTVPTETKVPPRLAAEVIHDRVLEDASREIANAWRRLHPAPAK